MRHVDEPRSTKPLCSSHSGRCAQTRRNASAVSADREGDPLFDLIQGAGVSLLVLFGLCVIGSFMFLILWSRRNRKRFPGLALKAIGHQHGQFKVGGFSPIYFQALKSLA